MTKYECEICNEYAVRLFRADTKDSFEHTLTPNGVLTHKVLDGKLICVNCVTSYNIAVSVKVY